VTDNRRGADFLTALLEVLANDGAGVAIAAVVVGAIILFALWWAT
jgi:hypothetical protein